MAFNIEFFKAAEDDLDEALTWYVGESASTARKFLDTYLNILDRLSDNPWQFPKVKNKIRKARFSKPFTYNIYFFVHDDTVFIVSVFHDKRSPKIWQNRV